LHHPLSVLSQIELSVGAPMRNAISAVPYAPALKVGLQFPAALLEQDEAIYGGISYTDLPIRLIGYPCTGYGSAGKAVVLAPIRSSASTPTSSTSLSPASGWQRRWPTRADPSPIQGGVRERHCGRLAPQSRRARLQRRLDRRDPRAAL